MRLLPLASKMHDISLYCISLRFVCDARRDNHRQNTCDFLSSIPFRGGPWIPLPRTNPAGGGDELRKHKYSGSQLSLLPAFTAFSNDWLCGDSYLDTAARQLRGLTGFHDAFVVSQKRYSVLSDLRQVNSPNYQHRSPLPLDVDVNELLLAPCSARSSNPNCIEPWSPVPTLITREASKSQQT